jgi:CheY-like chemotaxis protein
VEIATLPFDAAGKNDLAALLDDLARREINELHVEAGHKLNGSLLREGLVDELLIYIAPKLLGDGPGIAALPPLRSLDDAPGFEIIDVERGRDVRTVVGERNPDLVIVDLQIANMGGMAVSLDLRLEESGGRLPHVPILLLLDRQADKFLARRSTVDAMLVKPIDPGTLRRTVKTLLAANTPTETPSGPQEQVG